MRKRANEQSVTARKRSKVISFLTVPCLRCKAKRVLGQPCDECGCKAPAGEVNSRVVERRAAIERVQNHLRSCQVDINHHSIYRPDEENIGALLQDFIKALGDLISDPLSPDAAFQMAEVQGNIIGTLRGYEALPPLRPSVTLQLAITRSLTFISMLWPTYAQALTAPNLYQAQNFGEKGQHLIDEVLAELDTYKSLIAATKAYEDLSISDFLDRALAAVSVSHPGLSLLDLGRVGRQEATDLTMVETDEAHGAQYILLSTIASVHLDPDRFSAVIAESAKFCFAAPNLESIAQQESALDGLSSITRMLHESLTSFEAILARESDGDALLRRVIKFYGEIYEDVGGQLFAWYNLLANIKQQPYLKLIEQNDATKLARNLVDCPRTQSFLEDAGSHLRNAAQHGSSFSLSGEVVTFRLRSHQAQWTRAQVVDAVFSLLESLSAMSWSLSNALTQRGHPIPMSQEDAAYMRMTPFRLVTLWLKDNGTALVSASETERSWRFTIDKQTDGLFTLALTLAAGAPENISKIGVRSSSSDVDLIVPSAAYELFTEWPSADATPQEHLVAVLELRNHCLKGKDSLLTEGDLRYGVACLGLHVISGDQTVIPCLRRLQRMAKERGRTTEATIAAECIGLWRKPDAQKHRRMVATLNSWVNLNSQPEMPQANSVIVSLRT